MGNGWKVLSSFVFVVGMLILVVNFYPIFPEKELASLTGLLVMIVGSLMYAGYRIRLIALSFVLFIMVMIAISESTIAIIIGTIILAPLVILSVRKKK